MQTITGFCGNCQTAAIASLFKWPIEDVPYFADGLYKDNGKSSEENDKEFNDRVDKFLAKYDLQLLWYEINDEMDRYICEEFKDIPYQVQGLSPRGYQHVVIYLNGEMIHDPHPEGGGVVPQYYGFIYKLSH